MFKPDNYILSVWAKTDPFHPLLYHMIDVGNVALCLLSTKTFHAAEDKFIEATGCPPHMCKAWLAYLAAMHDIGKCDPDFQVKGGENLILPIENAGLIFKNPPDDSFRHEARSREWLLKDLEKTFAWGRKARNTVSYAILGHHSNFYTSDIDDNERLLKCWDPIRDVLTGETREIFNPPLWSPKDFIDHSTAGVILTGLIVLSDWIASNIELMEVESIRYDTDTYAKLSLKRASSAVKKLGFNDSIDWTGKNSFDKIWVSPEFKSLRPVQKACVDLCSACIPPGLAIIEAPMGEGKTEAAIYLASQWMAIFGLNGLYIALPTMATSNQMYDRTKAFITSHNQRTASGVRLVHGMSWLLDDETPIKLSSSRNFEDNAIEAVEWFRPKKRCLLAPYAVGTVDQALMSVLNVRFGFLRLFGLSGKVLIVDEVHAYDAYTTNILTLLLQWCSSLNIPVILLSATLPSNKRSELISSYTHGNADNKCLGTSYPLISYASKDGNICEKSTRESSSKVQIELVKHYDALDDYAKVAELAEKISHNGSCLCIILNTVKAAQKVYLKLKQLDLKDTTLLLFHSRFTVEKREEIEGKVLSLFDKRSLLPIDDPNRRERPKKAILVATQVVEQSLDLDFDDMIAEIAPIDLIFQRAGRLHRHNRSDRPTGNMPRLHILLPGSGIPYFGPSEKVYERYVLLRTLSSLCKQGFLDFPDDIKRLVEDVYVSDTMPIQDERYVITSDDLENANTHLKEKINDERGESAKYLIRDPNRGEFSIASMANACSLDEGDEGSASYFNARTRIGGDTRQVMAIGEGVFYDIIDRKASPPRATQKLVFKRIVNLPAWWIRDAIPEPGYQKIEEGQSWLRKILVLRFKSGIWKGIDRKGAHFVIRDDENIGFVREENKVKREE